MRPARYFALIYLQTAATRAAAERAAESGEEAQKLVRHVRSIYPEAKAVFTHPNAAIFAFVDSASAEGIGRKLAPGLGAGTVFSIIPVGTDVWTNHPGLQAWMRDTKFATE
jgi:hypothetical protein